MTFLTITSLKKQFPKHRIYLLSDVELALPEEVRKQYAFDFMGWFPVKYAKAQKNPLLHLSCYIRSSDELKVCEEIYQNTDLMIDISGYALGSNWSHAFCNDFLDHLEFAKTFGFPIYLMPQTFGPFDYTDAKGRAIMARCKKLLPYAKVIYAREQKSFDALVSNFGLTNVVLAKDMVLCGGEPNADLIFANQFTHPLPVISKNSVAIIPNQRNNRVGAGSMLDSLYQSIIPQLLAMGKTIYLLCHSNHDIELCQSLKNQFLSENRVVYLSQDFNCIEFNHLVKQFDFLIASRFHSIVHAYKNGIPCITLGWAEKYHQLLSLFHQEQYMFDVRKEIDPQNLYNAICTLNEHRDEESNTILTKLPPLRKEDVLLSTSFSLKEPS